ncbi:MAG: flagellar basal body P-ring formation protein FlgA [Alphaproteobacteria bacterium]|nr:flagellar basal body P-ring formation protein FlgA [Alphaproteobacteria bacterium]
MRKLLLAISLALSWLGIARADVAVSTPPAPAAPTIVSADAIAAKIADALSARLPVSGHYHVAFADPAFALSLPAAAQGHYQIANLSFDAMRQAFAGNLSYAGANGQPQLVGIVGTAYPAIEVPALAHDVAINDVIGPQDLMTIELPAERASTTLITNADDLAGQAARRPLRARQPIFAFDVKKPVIVKKGELVTLVFSLPGIELTAAGQALADGGKGDVIAVLNARSRRTIEGRVSAAGTVSVQTPTASLALAQH